MRDSSAQVQCVGGFLNKSQGGKIMLLRLAILLVLLFPVLADATPMRYELKLTGSSDNGYFDHTPISHNQLLPYGDGSYDTSSSSCTVCHVDSSDPARARLISISGVVSTASRHSAFFAVPLSIRFYGDTENVDTFPAQFSPIASGTVGTAAGSYLAKGRATLSPIQVAGPLRGIKDVAPGSYHSCAVDDSGAVLCWGSNSSGALGGTGADNSVPTPVPGLTSGVTSVVTGTGFSCAIARGGSVHCWGYNGDGELGNNVYTDSSVPVAVTGLSSGVHALVAGVGHTCALKADQSVWCWGQNGNGQLGNGSTTASPVPVAVSGLGSGVRTLSAGAFHTCALKNDGSVLCWGLNGDGELGNNASSDSSIPVAVTGLSSGSGVRAVATGQSDTCALKNDQSVWCWGYNFDGELGNTSGVSSAVPIAISALSSGSGVVALAAGGDYTSIGSGICALKSDGSVWCWGANYVGELGNNSYANSAVPVAVSGLPSGVTSLASGVYNGTTCALTHAGGVSCWGWNRDGQLARGGAPNIAAPALFLPSPSRFVSASFDPSAGLFVSVDSSHHSIGVSSGWPANITPTLPGGVLDDSAPCEWPDNSGSCPLPTIPVDTYDLKSAFAMTGFDLISGAFPAGWPVSNNPLPLIGGGNLVLNSFTPRAYGQGSFSATPLVPARTFLVYGSTRGAPAQSSVNAHGTLTLGSGAKAFNPATDDFVFGFGPYTALLPPGSLSTNRSGALVFSGDVNGTEINLSLNPSGSTYEFKLSAQNANLSNAAGKLDFPVDVEFYLGDNAAAGTLQSASE